MTTRRIGEQGVRRIAPETTREGEAQTVYSFYAVCEALDDAPDEAQYLLFVATEGKQFIYWGETAAGPWEPLIVPES